MEENKGFALITGGAQGLGRYLAEYLHKRGYGLIILDIQSFETLPDSYREIIQSYYQVDLSDISLLNKIIDEILYKHAKIDVLINNASLRIFRVFLDFTDTDIKRYVDVNFRAPILLSMRILPVMRKYCYGRIINISSRSGFWGYKTGSLYCSTKSALIKFTEALGRELADNINDVTANVICPGSFSKTDHKKHKGYDRIMSSIAKTIDRIISSRRSGEVVPVLSKKNLLLEIFRDIKKNILWLMKY